MLLIKGRAQTDFKSYVYNENVCLSNGYGNTKPHARYSVAIGEYRLKIVVPIEES